MARKAVALITCPIGGDEKAEVRHLKDNPSLNLYWSCTCCGIIRGSYPGFQAFVAKNKRELPPQPGAAAPPEPAKKIAAAAPPPKPAAPVPAPKRSFLEDL